MAAVCIASRDCPTLAEREGQTGGSDRCAEQAMRWCQALARGPEVVALREAGRSQAVQQHLLPGGVRGVLLQRSVPQRLPVPGKQGG